MASNEVLNLTSWKARIWKHLHDMFVGAPIGKFYRWEVDGEGNVTFQRNASYEITPGGFAANEESKNVVLSDNRRSNLREIEFILWSVRLDFSQEAVTEHFDKKLFDLESTFIPAGVDEDGERIPPFTLNVVEIVSGHPPQQGANHGSSLRYTIQVVPGRS